MRLTGAKTMSHDRGCHCGKEPYEYSECRDRECRRSPVYDVVYHAQQVAERLGAVKHPAIAGGTPPRETFKPGPQPRVVVGAASYDSHVLIVHEEGRIRGYQEVPRGREVQIEGPCRVRVHAGRMEVVVNPDITIAWTGAGPKGKKGRNPGGTSGP
jgi:hypothetical protein